MKKIYLDHAATTYVKEEVMKEMTKYFTEDFGNASSGHSIGREGAKGVAEAREIIAREIGADPHEIYFTSGGSEADNWALRGIAKKKQTGHIITSEIEHPAVIETAQELEKEGFEVTYVGVNKEGIVSVEDIEKAIRKDTILISIMAANNEVGSIQPIEEIGALARRYKIPFHTDAVQAMGAMEIDVKKMRIDLLSMSAHKFYGPKGVGVLYIRSGLAMGKIITGGYQERGMRAGTTVTPLVVGMAKALEIANQQRESENKRLSDLRDYMIDEIVKKIPNTFVNGSREKRLPNNVNISFEYIEGEGILMLLDMMGICVSTGSACSSGALKSSHVLVSMGVSVEIAHGSVRFTLGEKNTKEDIDYTVEKLAEVVERLRGMSPLLNSKGERVDV